MMAGGMEIPERGMPLIPSTESMQGAVDLNTVKDGHKKNLVQGFRLQPTQVHVGEGQMIPVLGVKFVMIDGSERAEVLVPPQMLMALIANLSGFGLSIQPGMTQIG